MYSSFARKNIHYVNNDYDFRCGFSLRTYLNFRPSTILITDAFSRGERERERERASDSSPAVFAFPGRVNPRRLFRKRIRRLNLDRSDAGETMERVRAGYLRA